MRTLLLVLPNERPVSWNDFYSGQHWSVRKAEKDRVQMVVRSVTTQSYRDRRNPRVEILIEATE